MNRKRKLKYFYKVAANKPLSMREKILGGVLGMAAAVGGAYMAMPPDSPQEVPVETVEVREQTPQELDLIDYEIKSGDNIRNICLKLFPGHASRAQKHILEINGLDENSVKNLRPGRIIKIPSSKEVFVDHFDLEENHHLSASSKIKEFIKQKETLHSLPKKVEEDSDIETVGYGRRLNTPEKRIEYENTKKLLINSGRKDGALAENDPVVLQWLEKDIKEAEDRVKARALPGLTQGQFDALISVSFNAGDIPDIKEDLKSGNVNAAADKIRNHSSKMMKKYPGLKDRRSEEANLFLEK